MGSIKIENKGAYTARAYVEYTKSDQQRTTWESGDFTAGVSKGVELPPGATSIMVKAEENTGAEWSLIFIKDYSSVVSKTFILLGTTLDPYYKEQDG